MLNNKEGWCLINCRPSLLKGKSYGRKNWEKNFEIRKFRNFAISKKNFEIFISKISLLKKSKIKAFMHKLKHEIHFIRLIKDLCSFKNIKGFDLGENDYD